MDLGNAACMWLAMEKRVAHRLNVLHDARLTIPDEPARESLVLLAAHTRLPEASVLAMPSVARSELELGLDGALRQRIASTAADDEPALELLRNALLVEVGSWCGASDAVAICDALHGGRLLRRESPPIVGADLLRWYHHYRRAAGPKRSLLEQIERRHEAWLAEPERRTALESEIYDLVLADFGGVPAAFADRDLRG